MKVSYQFLLSCSAVMALQWPVSSLASVTLSGTRVVLNAGQKEGTILARNGGGNILLQSWLDAGDESQNKDLPITVSPPLVAVSANQSQVLRIMPLGVNMPQDKESVYWLNVQEIPEQAEGENRLQLAVRIRIKVFYRPKGLSGSLEKAMGGLQWQMGPGGEVKVQNPSQYHVSMVDIQAGEGKGAENVSNGQMIAPLGSVSFKLKNPSRTLISYDAVDDYGATRPFQVTFSGTAPSQPKPIAKER